MRSPRLIVFAALVALVGGCTSTRSLERVRLDGDQNFRYERYERAAADYAELVERDPNDWAYRVKLAETLSILGDHARAEEHLAIVAGVRPHDDTIAERYARAMFDAGHHNRLISYLQRRAQDTGAVRDYLRLGWYAMQTGDADGAERALLTAARLDRGRSIEPQLALADFYLAAGDHDEGVRRLRMALYIEPTNEAVRQRLRALGEVPGPSLAIVPDEQP
ncbi:MAG: hypothetical protein D6693_04470 [Planctomycetota bacterium]|nr:MAG: hypothetical protein D6693_04470 [Planctomycetota bacterium]